MREHYAGTNPEFGNFVVIFTLTEFGPAYSTKQIILNYLSLKS